MDLKQILKYREQIKSLEGFIIDFLGSPFTKDSRNELLKRAAVYVELFEKIGVPSYLIQEFYALFDVRNTDNIIHFKERMGTSIEKLRNQGRLKEILSNRIFEPVRLIKHVAISILDSLEEEYSVVPKWLLQELDQYPKFATIVSLLTDIENRVKQKDSKTLLFVTCSLLEQVLKFNTVLIKDAGGGNNKKVGMRKIISKLIAKNGSKYRKFFGSFDRYFYMTLANLVTIRNAFVHSCADLKTVAPPFPVVLTGVYLVIVLLESTLLRNPSLTGTQL